MKDTRKFGDRIDPSITEKQIRDDALQFKHHKDWMNASRGKKPNMYWQAKLRGFDFFLTCVSHMTRAPKTQPQKYTDDQVVAALSAFKTKVEAKKTMPSMLIIARRSEELYKRATAHMVPASNPYAGAYIIYAYEFADGFAYVGLTCKPEDRALGHLQKGPVFERCKCCSTPPVYRVVQHNILNPVMASQAEAHWQEEYAKNWKPLHSARAGSLGTVAPRWTPDRLLLEALKYETKDAFRRGSQYAYKEAKLQGCFDECVAHMPKRTNKDLLGRKFSAETREKMRQAKLGKILSDDHKRKIGDSVLKTPKAERAAKISSGMKKFTSSSHL